MKHIPLSCPPDRHFAPILWSRALLAASVLAALPASAQIAAWDFFGESSPATSTADIFDAGLDSATTMTRGAGAAASTASNSFRTQGFQNNGIATANTDYFQITLSATPGNTLSLSSIDARFNGTGTFFASPGVSAQFAYSLDGTTFTLIGSPFSMTAIGAMSQVSLSGVSQLQAVPDTTTVTLRYYASGQTATGGWGFASSASGLYGLAIGGAVAPAGATPLTVSALPTTFAENAGAGASTGTVSIPTALGADLVVTLASSDTTEATVPASVTILAGNTSATFPIDAVNDLLADGSQSVNVNASASGYVPGQVGLTVDNDTDAAINVSVISNSFLENAGAGAAHGTITLAENTVADLTVNLTSNDLTEATVPASVTIAAGTKTITFDVDAVDDFEVDGTRNVTIQAAATGYTSGNTVIQVLDDGDVPPPATLSPGAIAFVGFNADGTDDVAFVVLSPIAPGDKILFTDNEWNGSPVGPGGTFNTGEGVLTWTAPAGGVAVGTIVTLNSLTTVGRSASEGTLVLTTGSMDLSGSGDTLYAYQGAVQVATGFLAVIATQTTDSIVGTGLSASHAIYLPTNIDIAAYTGSRSSQTTYANYLTLLGDTATNWVTGDGSGDQSIDTTAPDVPFSTTAFTLAAANSYAAWIAGYPAVGALTGPNDDFDGDGLDNAIENILGSDPSVGNVGLTTISGTSSSVTFRHSRADSPATDLTASYEWSTDLTTWYSSGAGGGITVTIGAPTVITDGSPNDIVEVTATVTSGTATSLFVHLKATNP